MILPKNETWEQWGITEEHHKFFIARWQELFDEDTLDTWQVRYTNIRSILEEILQAIKIVEDVHIYHHNISSLIEEAEHIVHHDIILKEYFPFVGAHLKKIKLSYDENVKNDKCIDPNSFKRLTKVLLGNLAEYQNRVVHSLRETILNPPEKYKITLYYITMSLAVELRLAGYSICSLRDSINILINPSETQFVDRFDKLMATFSKPRQRFVCRFFISWPKPYPNLSKYGIRFTHVRPDTLSATEECEFFAQDEQALIVTVNNITALDPFEARNKAQELLERFFSLNKLYTLSKESKIKQKKALIYDAQKKQYIIPEDTSRLAYIKGSNYPHSEVEKFAKIQERLSESDRGQLFASLQHHKLSLIASTDEARLVNLWVALETLVQDGSRNVIERISRYIPYSDATGYIARIARAFPKSFFQLWRSTDTKEFRTILKSSNEKILHTKDVLSILMDVKDGDIVLSFLNFAKDHPLLLFRANRLWDKTFGGPTVMAHQIESHKKHIDWQIRRIYRARNSIIHQGCCPLGARQLIQHLHSYYMNVIHNLIHDLVLKPDWTIADSLEHRRLLYDTFLQRLREYHKDPFSAECLIEPRNLLGKTEAPPAWGEEKLKEEHKP